MRRSERYIVDGHIVHNNNNQNNNNNNDNTINQRRYPSHWRFASWKRIGILISVLSIFIVTNPANELLSPSSMRRQGRPKNNLSSKRITNYGLFSLQEERLNNSVRIFALQHSWQCDYFDSDIGTVCEIIGANMAHGRPLVWDPTDRAHSAHRIICGILILSAMTSFCFPGAPQSSSIFIFQNYPYLVGFLSVFHRPNLLWDLFHANMTVYPALLKMSRILPELKTDSLLFSSSSNYSNYNNHDMEFAFYAFLLVIIIGGGCNILASRLTDRYNSSNGFATTVAASLAYLHRISVHRNPALFYIFDKPVTAIGAYWSILTLSVFQKQQNGNRNSNWFTFGVAWLLAGLLGSGLAKYHLENLFLLGDIYKFFGMT